MKSLHLTDSFRSLSCLTGISPKPKPHSGLLKFISKLRLSTLLFYFLFTFNISLVKADWVQVNNGITQYNINSLTATGNYLFAGTMGFAGGGLFVSTNNGMSWTQAGIYNTTLSLASSGSYVYAGYQNGLRISTNYGLNWTLSDLGRWVNSIAANDNFVFAGCRDTGVFVSSNYGIDWTQTSLSNRIIYSIIKNGSNVFAATWNNGVYSSNNNGVNWVQTSLPLTTFNCLAAYDNNVYTGSHTVFLSTNNGLIWIQTNLNIPVYALAIYGNNIIAGTGYGIYVSNDSGTNWQQRNEGLNGYILSLCISNGYIFAGADGSGVFRRPLSELVGIDPISNVIPGKFKLFQNYPNPFNPNTIISFSIPNSGNVKLSVFDITGREVAEIFSEFKPAGSYEINFNSAVLSSGVYFYRLSSGSIYITRKMLLVK